eukprot:1153702-Pelagomonas_calceolata.AAC.6
MRCARASLRPPRCAEKERRDRSQKGEMHPLWNGSCINEGMHRHRLKTTLASCTATRMAECAGRLQRARSDVALWRDRNDEIPCPWGLLVLNRCPTQAPSLPSWLHNLCRRLATPTVSPGHEHCA